MDDLRKLTSRQNASLVIFSFLQVDYTLPDYDEELFSLGEKLKRDINCNGSWIDSEDDGGLETDGHLPSSISLSLDDIQPSVQLHRPADHAEAAVLQEVAAGLREIAAQLEYNVVAQATQNLSKNILSSHCKDWKKYLSQEVDKAMRQGVGLEHLPQERIIMALSLTLVKGVCQQVPRLLKDLFDVALQYISPASAR